jgi:arylsulfatase A-like enzyme
MFRTLLKALAAMLAIQSVAWTADLPAKPNIVFILADDLGWKDLSCFGSYAYKSPNIDRLCSEGMKFTHAYVYPSCSPTRSGLMTGMDPARIGITIPVCHQDQVVLQATLRAKAAKWENLVTPTCVTRLDTKYVSYATILKEAGYVTGHFGKWHLGREPYSPFQHGFDVDIPHVDIPGPGASYTYPWYPKITAGMKLPILPKENLEDHMAREACAFIEKNKDKPFLLNYWAFSVHGPYNGKEAYVQKHKDLYNTYTPQRSPIYAAMVESLDDAVGSIMDTLQRTGIADRTIVIFLSDNGGNISFGDIKSHPEYQGTPETSNTPLREGKGWVYEGGVRSPLIVKWPLVVKPGTISHALVSLEDIYPTLLQMAGAQPREDQPLDGVSIVPVLKEQKASVRSKVFCIEPQYCYNYFPEVEGPAASIHSGDWKLIHFYDGNSNSTDRLELYNLKDDIGETFDMSAGMPELTAKLSKQLDNYIASIHAVMPIQNPNFDQKVLRAPEKRQPSQPVILPRDDGD